MAQKSHNAAKIARDVGSPANWFIPLTLALLIVAPPIRAGGADSTQDQAKAILQQCQATQRPLKRMSMQVEARIAYSPHREKPYPSHHLVTTLFRRDGDLLDVSGRHFMLDSMQADSYGFRIVLSREYYAVNTYNLATERGPHSGAISKRDATANRSRKLRELICSHDGCSSCLDGYLAYSDGKGMAEHLLESPTLHFRGGELIDSTPCKVLEAKTNYGRMRLWLAEAKGCVPVRAEYEKTGTDLFTDKPLSQTSFVDRVLQRWSGIVDRVSITQIGDVWVADGGRMVETEYWADNSRHVREFTFKRSAIDFRPKFEGTSAFQIDIPEGASVSNQDDRESGVQYQWGGGEMGVGHSEFDEGAEGFWTHRSGISRTIYVAFGLAFAFGAIWMALRHRSRRSP
jgi:hypothetical protein